MRTINYTGNAGGQSNFDFNFIWDETTSYPEIASKIDQYKQQVATMMGAA